MKLIVAYVQPFVMERVVEALHLTTGVSGATVADARGFGRGRRSAEEEEEVFGTSARTRIEVAADDDHVEQIVHNIRVAAHTGKRGDGKILVLPLEDVVRIQTGEQGPLAL